MDTLFDAPPVLWGVFCAIPFVPYQHGRVRRLILCNFKCRIEEFYGGINVQLSGQWKALFKLFCQKPKRNLSGVSDTAKRNALLFKSNY